MQKASTGSSTSTTASEKEVPKNSEGHIMVTHHDIAASRAAQPTEHHKQHFTPYFAQMGPAPVKFNKIEVHKGSYEVHLLFLVY